MMGSGVQITQAAPFLRKNTVLDAAQIRLALILSTLWPIA